MTDRKSNHWPRDNHEMDDYHDGGHESLTRDDSGPNLQHISEREPDDLDRDPSVHPSATTLFIEKSKRAIQSK